MKTLRAGEVDIVEFGGRQCGEMFRGGNVIALQQGGSIQRVPQPDRSRSAGGHFLCEGAVENCDIAGKMEFILGAFPGERIVTLGQYNTTPLERADGFGPVAHPAMSQMGEGKNGVIAWIERLGAGEGGDAFAVTLMALVDDGGDERNLGGIRQ